MRPLPLATALVLAVTLPALADAATYRDLCDVDPSGGRHCDVKIRTDPRGRFEFGASPIGGYGPADVQSAYGLPANGGGGRLVAIFAGDSDYTNAESDLGAYRAQYGLPPCTAANGCFLKVDEHGGASFPAAGANEVEQALDMEMVSAACPGCRIMLVEGGDMDVALATVRAAGASAFSFSILYGFGDATATECASLGFDDPSGLVMTGALGDTAYPGARDYVPAACKGVLAVGGTSLTKASSARGWSETTWSGTGSGCSPFVAKPSWQTDTGCATRMEADVAAVADPGTGLAFYCTEGGSGWGIVGGTSAASPLVSGALTALGVANGYFSPAWVWQNGASFFDVATGSNGACAGGPSYYCTAGAGYDGPTGWGTPDGALLAIAPPPAYGAPDAGAGCVQPGGSYLQTCAGCSVANAGGCELTCASCTKIDGTQNPNPSLPLPCTGTIDNDDGALACSGGAPVVDAGAADTGVGVPSDAGTDATTAPAPPPPAVGGNGAAPQGAPSVVSAASPAPTSDDSAGCACATRPPRGGASAIAASLAIALLSLRRRARRS